MKHFDNWMTDRSITRKKVDSFMADISNVGKRWMGNIYIQLLSTGNPWLCSMMKLLLMFHLQSVFFAVLPESDMKAMKQGKRTLHFLQKVDFICQWFCKI